MAATMRMETALILIVAATFCAGAVAQSNDCNNVLISMSPCLDYITGNSSTPASSCCSRLANVVKSQPQCLCAVVSGSGSSQLGININQTQAMALPNACKVQTPPVSRCSGSSPSGTPQSPSGSGSKTVPTTNGDSSNGNATNLTFSVLLLLLFVASYISTSSSV